MGVGDEQSGTRRAGQGEETQAGDAVLAAVEAAMTRIRRRQSRR
ncbi:MarR family transcriptional regulator, partial [Streptomyces sp. NRRL F-6602]